MMDNVHVGAPARTQVICSKCGKATTVPFTPTPGRPVFCRECFGSAPPRQAPGSPARGPPMRAEKPNVMARKRMMAQGRKGHFMFDAQALMNRLEGGMDEQHQRAFLEGLFARGARTSTEAAIEFLDEKLADTTITKDQHGGLAQLVDRYSFWR